MEYIAKPNPDNTDFLHYANDKVIKRILLGDPAPASWAGIATNFHDLVMLREMYRKNRRKPQPTTPAEKVISKMLNNTALAGWLTWLSLIAIIVGFVCVLAFTISNTENFFFQLAVLAVAESLATGAALGIIYFKEEGYLKAKRQLAALNHSHEKEYLAQVPVVFLERHELEPYRRSLNNVSQATQDVLQWRETCQNYSLDMSHFARAYDSYMETFVFVHANKDAMSEELFEKYVTELTALAEHVAEETGVLRNIVKEINRTVAFEMKKAYDFKKVLDTQRQEETDIAIATHMPLFHQQKDIPHYL